jgi:hypothetical protein
MATMIAHFVVIVFVALLSEVFTFGYPKSSGVHAKQFSKRFSNVTVGSAAITDGACVGKCRTTAANMNSLCFAAQFQKSTSMCFMVTGCSFIVLINDGSNDFVIFIIRKYVCAIMYSLFHD